MNACACARARTILRSLHLLEQWSDMFVQDSVYNSSKNTSLLKIILCSCFRSTWNRFHYIYKGRKRTNVTKTPFRYNFTFYKGSSYVALSHSFANYTLNSQVANEFLEWVKDTGFPDETFLPSLIGNAKFPSPASKCLINNNHHHNNNTITCQLGTARILRKVPETWRKLM